MKRTSCFVLVAVIQLLVAVVPAEPVPVNRDADDWRRDQDVAAQDTWPSFRGRGARGIAVGQDLPEQWDVTKSEGVRWKT